MSNPRARELRQEYEDGERAAHYAKHRWTRSRRARRAARKESLIVESMLAQAGELRAILDVPCGTGRFHGQLLAHAPVWSVDASLAMLREHSARSLRGAAASAHALPFRDDAVDLVFCSRLLHHFEHSAQRVDVMRELARVSGRWLIASYFDAACFQAWRNRIRGRFRGRWPVPQQVFEADAAKAGWQVCARRAMLPGISEQVWLLMERKEWAGS